MWILEHVSDIKSTANLNYFPKYNAKWILVCSLCLRNALWGPDFSMQGRRRFSTDTPMVVKLGKTTVTYQNMLGKLSWNSRNPTARTAGHNYSIPSYLRDLEFHTMLCSALRTEFLRVHQAQNGMQLKAIRSRPDLLSLVMNVFVPGSANESELPRTYRVICKRKFTVIINQHILMKGSQLTCLAHFARYCLNSLLHNKTINLSNETACLFKLMPASPLGNYLRRFFLISLQAAKCKSCVYAHSICEL